MTTITLDLGFNLKAQLTEEFKRYGWNEENAAALADTEIWLREQRLLQQAKDPLCLTTSPVHTLTTKSLSATR